MPLSITSYKLDGWSIGAFTAGCLVGGLSVLPDNQIKDLFALAGGALMVIGLSRFFFSHKHSHARFLKFMKLGWWYAVGLLILPSISILARLLG